MVRCESQEPSATKRTSYWASPTKDGRRLSQWAKTGAESLANILQLHGAESLGDLSPVNDIPWGYGKKSKDHDQLVATFGREFTWDFSDEKELAKWTAQLEKQTTKRKGKRK